jgi:two-component system sensor histidine kinase/response regulator
MMDIPKIEIPALRADGTTQRSVMPVGERAGVLIVDDTPAKLTSLVAIVSGMELEIETATSGEQALRQLLKRDFALILLDVNMPTMDGFETAKLIRSRPRSEYTPIIFVTAEANSEAERISGYTLGAVDFIYSPIIPEILRAKVQVFVNLFYLQRQLLLHTEELKARQQELANSNQRLSEREEEIHAVLDNLVDCVLTIDARGIVKSANPAVLRVLGYTPAELIGHNVSRLMPEPDHSAHDGYLQRYLATGEAHIIGIGREVVGQHKDGRLIPLELAVNEYHAHGERFFTGTLHDFSERKRYIAALMQAQEDAEAANRAKSVFLAAMSHEIRTPMNGVIGMVELLGQSALDVRQREMVETVRESSFSLLRIIDDILDFSKLEAGKLSIDPTPLSLESVVEGVCDALASVAEARQVSLYPYIDPALPRQVLGDAGRLRQIFNNLIGNAIKFSSSSQRCGQVAVRAELRAREGERVRLAFIVTDNGIGLSAEEQLRLFQPFSQADASTTRRFGGTGLGLSIVHRLVDLMQGGIEVSSTPGQGATFTVSLTLPVLADAADAEPKEAALQGLECLLASPQPERARDLAAYLTAAGAQVHEVPDPFAALRQMDALHPGGNWLVIHDSGLEKPSQEDLLAVVATLHQPHLLVLLTHGRRHRPRVEAPGFVTLDIEILHRQTLLDAVLIAAGRQPADLPAAPEPAAAQSPAPHLPILVAEDNETNRKVIQHQLDVLGYRAEMAENGQEALARWRQGSFSLVLTDLHMPKLDGNGLAAAIRREEPPGQRIPIVALTANILQEDRDRCLQIGMDDFLTKPMQLATLKASLERWLVPAVSSPAHEQIAHGAVPGGAAPGLAVLDTAVLAELLGSTDQAMLDEFLQDYRASTLCGAAELHAAAAAGNPAAMGAAAHKLKSSSRSVGALALGEVCARLEQAGRAGDAAALPALTTEFDSALAAALAALDDRLG